MKRQVTTAAFAIVLGGCQLQSNTPTAVIQVPGNYKALADCFFLKVRGEGFWSKDDLDSQNAAHVRLGNVQYEAGRIEFVGTSPEMTQVTFRIAHPNKFEPRVRECSA